MGRKSEKTRHLDSYVTLNIRIKGRMKNEIVAYAEKQGISVNQMCVYALYEFVRNQKGIPAPGSAQFSIPTIDEQIISYVRGEPLLKPCGQKDCQQKITQLDLMQFCETCNLRIL